jgi:hypothetical protein
MPGCPTPEPVTGALFGKGGVHTLDGEAHRMRRAMFVALLMNEDGIARHEEAATVPAVRGWAGIPVATTRYPTRNLGISLRRIPALPAGRTILEVRGTEPRMPG